MLTYVTGQIYTTLRPERWRRSGKAICRGPGILPIATTLLHGWVWLGRWLTRLWFVPHTASTMTNRRWLRARDCISARRITISGRSWRLQQFPLFLNDPFPSNYPFPVPGSALAIQRDLRTPYLQQWNFNVQRGLGSGRVLELTYAGTKGTKLVAARDINQPRPSTAAAELASESALRRHQYFGVARELDLSFAAGSIRAEILARVDGAGILHVREINR